MTTRCGQPEGVLAPAAGFAEVDMAWMSAGYAIFNAKRKRPDARLFADDGRRTSPRSSTVAQVHPVKGRRWLGVPA